MRNARCQELCLGGRSRPCRKGGGGSTQTAMRGVTEALAYSAGPDDGIRPGAKMPASPKACWMESVESS